MASLRPWVFASSPANRASASGVPSAVARIAVISRKACSPRSRPRAIRVSDAGPDLVADGAAATAEAGSDTAPAPAANNSDIAITIRAGRETDMIASPSSDPSVDALQSLYVAVGRPH